MYVIKMNNDKSLETTIHATIYQYEHNADTLIFLIPKTYGDFNIADSSVALRYILPDDSGVSEVLEIDLLPYNENYYRYHLQIQTQLTSIVGEVKLWLAFVGASGNLILKSGEATIEINESEDITEHLSSSEQNQLDMLEARINSIEQTQIDGMTYNNGNRNLQLTSNGAHIGSAVVVPSDDYSGDISGGVSDEWGNMDDI